MTFGDASGIVQASTTAAKTLFTFVRMPPAALYPVLHYVNQTLMVWARRKFKRFKGHKLRASLFLQRLAAERRDLLVHWDIGMTGVFT